MLFFAFTFLRNRDGMRDAMEAWMMCRLLNRLSSCATV